MEEIPYGYCHCGCGQKTKLAPRTCTEKGWKNGEHLRFINHHHSWKRWKERFNAYGYKIIAMRNHPRSHGNGKILFEHILVAEKALGKPIQKGTDIHHFPSKENFTHLVICQDHAYHALLHIRYRALLACGNPNWRKCAFCKKYDDIKNLYCFPNGYGYKHHSCSNAHQREYRKKLESTLPPLNQITEDSQ